MGKLPAFQFYPSDWLEDGVAGCSLAAQGLWLRMMIVAHGSPRYGYLCNSLGSPMPPEAIASKCGCSVEVYRSLLAELDLATVPSRTRAGTIFSRRMVRDQKRRQQWKDSQRKHRESTTSLPVNTMSRECQTLSSIFPASTSNLKPNTKADPPPLFFSGHLLKVTKTQNQRLCEVYGLVPVSDYAEADLWLEANPAKKRKNHYAFMRNWLSRSKASNGHSRVSAEPASGPEVPASPPCARCGRTKFFHDRMPENRKRVDSSDDGHGFVPEVAVSA